MRIHTWRACLLLIFTVLFVPACASPSATPLAAAGPVGGGGQPAQPQPQPTDTSPGELIAARVNGQTIPLALLEREVARRLDGLRALQEPLPADMDAFRLAALNALIEQLLIEQAAAIQGVQVTAEAVDAEYRASLELAGGIEQLRAQLQVDRLTEEEYRAGLRATLITQRMRDIVTRDACKNVEQTNARHILVADETTAAQIKQQLDAGGDFAALAAQFSLDVTTRQSGGDLGWFARGQLFQKSVEDAAFTLPKGAISAPIKSDLGYHILQVIDRAQDRPVDAETCSVLAQGIFERWIADLVSKAAIERFPNGAAG